MTIYVEVEDTSNEFKFRLVRDDGKCSGWAGYTQIAYLDGMCTATNYYLGDGTKFPILSTDDMIKRIAVI